MCQYVKAFYLLEEICRFVRFAMNGWARKGCFRYRKIDVLGGFLKRIQSIFKPGSKLTSITTLGNFTWV